MLLRILSRAIALLPFVIAVGMSPQATGQTVYSVNAAFLDNEKPDGNEVNPFVPFTYGYSTNPSNPGAFVPFAGTAQHTNAFAGTGSVEGWFVPNNASVPAVLQNTSGGTLSPGYAPSGILAGELLLHPGNPNANAHEDTALSPVADAIVRFTATVTGEYDIVGNFRSQASGNVNSRVLRNGVVLQTVGDAGPISILDILLNAGDVIDFAVDNATDGIGSDSTGLTATITATAIPEPSAIVSWACGSIAALAICLRFRRRSAA